MNPFVRHVSVKTPSGGRFRAGSASLCAALILALIPGIAHAVPACPKPVVFTQPDGHKVPVYLRGDEFLHWHEAADGYTVMREEGTGAWVYATAGTGGAMVPSRLYVGRDDPATLGIPAHFLPAGAVQRAQADASARLAASGSAAPREGTRTTTMKNLVVLVGFSDKPGTRTVAEYTALFNTPGYSTDGAQGSVRDYYTEVSYGALTIESTVADWVTLDNGYAHYGANDAYGNDLRPREMVQEALAKLEARGFNFAPFDGDGDGWVDGLTIIHAGGGEEYDGNDPDYIWSHMWAMASSVTYDGKRMRNYHTEPERRGWDNPPLDQGITRVGTICHENGHFLGLPDLYDYDYDSEGAGLFCLMAGGNWNGDYGTRPSHPSAWCKKALNWINPTVVIGAGACSVPRVETSPTAYRLQGCFPSSQYFLIENRQGYGFDDGLPGPTRGLLIWHVDETIANNNDQTHYMVDLEEASGTQHLELNSNEGDDADYYRQGNNISFTTRSSPNNLSYAGAAPGFNVVNVSSSGATMTFTIGLVTGACCTPAGTCTVTTQAACAAWSTWQGACMACAPNPCVATGACCTPTGTCAVTTQAACPAGNAWRGASSACSPNPCGPPSVNGNGVLWVHDTGMVFTAGTDQPIISAPPAGYEGVDNQQPSDGIARVWKVYAAFPPESSPRLTGVGWGIQFPEPVTSPYAYVILNADACNLPNADGPGTDFSIEQFGFPTTSGGMIAQAFPYGPRTTNVVELYYFTGFAYVGPSGGPVTFSTVPHSTTENRVFMDDAIPANLDPIMGYGSLGFGQAGTTPRPEPVVGACCDPSTWVCEITTPLECQFDWLGTGIPCAAQNCTDPAGVDGRHLGAPQVQLVIVPNPGAGGLVIRCRLPMRTPATLRLFDASGRIVRCLHDGDLPAGETPLLWDGRDDAGRKVSAGVYLVKATTATGETSGRAVLTR